MYHALTCERGTSGLFLAASPNTCLVLFRNIASSSGMWLWSVSWRTVGGSVKSVCSRPGQPGTVQRQRCLAGYLPSFRKEYPLTIRFVPLPDFTNLAFTYAIARIRLVNYHMKCRPPTPPPCPWTAPAVLDSAGWSCTWLPTPTGEPPY